MKTVTINERAAVMAIDAAVGPEARAVIENLYNNFDMAMKIGYDTAVTEMAGVIDELEQIGEMAKATAKAEGYAQGYFDGTKEMWEPTEDDGFYEDNQDEEGNPAFDGYDEDGVANDEVLWNKDPVTGEWHEQVRRD